MPEHRPALRSLLLAGLLAGCTADQPPAPAAQAVSDCILQPPAEPRMCTMQWDPVCGCDGKTYSNACVAAAAGVPRSTPGACEPALD